MRKGQRTEARIVAIARESEADGLTIERCAKPHGITLTNLFWRRKRFIGPSS